MSSPLVSVVIPAFNRASSITSTIESILAQTFTDFELIVVDDGSTDETAAKVQAFGDAVVLIRQQNKGITGARNTGLRHARGKWIALQDSDDLWLPGKLEQHIRDLEAHPHLKVFFVECWLQRSHLGSGEVLSFTHSGFINELKGSFTTIERPLWHQIRYGVAWVQGTLIERALLEKVGFYDEQLRLFTDYDLFCRLALEAPWGINTTPLVRIQRLPDDKSYVSSQRSKTPERGYQTMAYIMNKLRSRPDLDERERAIVHKRLRDSLSGLGNVLLAKGKVKEARAKFKEALKIEFSAGLFVKILATFLKRDAAHS
ncbi:MAG: glycosyltransferase [Opitutaceae bacterium]|nr:glycosyltransferase [Opitutaceae bacterium]